MQPELLRLYVTFLVLSAVIVVAGTFLSKFADILADRTGVGRTMGGMLLLASATSLPELSVDCKAALIGEPDIALGAVLGSSIFNLLILGALDLLVVRRERIISPVSSSHVLPAVTTVILTAIVVGFVCLDLPLQFGRVGLGTFLAFVFYLYCLRIVYLEHMINSADEPDAYADDGTSTWRATVGYFVCTIVILVAAGSLAPTAERLAVLTNLGGTFIGSTFVALTTSLPELVTTFAAIRMGAFDMAVGNILGSNAFNMAILFPVDLFYTSNTKSLLRDADISNAVTGSAVVLVTCIVIMALVYRPRRRNRLLDPGAPLVVLLSIGAFVLLYFLTPLAMQ